MNCLKCGREVTEEQVFCDDCLETMEQYPVDPDARVRLPRRQESAAPRKPVKRRTIAPEEQILLLTKRIRLLLVLLVIAVAAAVALAYPAAKHLMEDRLAPGQNYSTVTTPPSNGGTP